jgi:hypothetical protein
MTELRTSRPAPEADQISGHSVLVKTGSGLAVLPRRRRDGVSARLHADALDSRLAAGEPPENGRLLAVRRGARRLAGTAAAATASRRELIAVSGGGERRRECG